MNTSGYYRQTAYYWDIDENEYTLEAVFYHEDGMREIPDSDMLYSLELLECDNNAPDITRMLSKGSDIWREIENECSILGAEWIGQEEW